MVRANHPSCLTAVVAQVVLCGPSMARSGSIYPAITVADSLRPVALEAVRAAAAHHAPPPAHADEAQPRGRAWFVLWFLGAAVFSFSTMAALERRGLSELLMPAPPAPAQVTVEEPPIAFSMTRHTLACAEALMSPWRHPDRAEAYAPTAPPAPPASPRATPAATPVVAAKAKPASPRAAAPPAAAKLAAGSGSDEVAAAAALLEKAKAEHTLH